MLGAAGAVMRRRSQPLDAIRALAVLAVMTFHAAAVYDFAQLDAAGRWVLRYGFLGVDVFFPLSGYLITSYLVREPRPGHTRVFFLRRFFRIVPLYMAALAVFAVASLVTGVEAHLLDRMWIPATFLTGWLVFTDGRDTIPYLITWSVSVEEFAYILFGLLALALRRNFAWVLAAFALAATGLRLWLYAEGFGKGIYYFPPARLDSIALGGLVAIARLRGRAALPWLLLGLALCFPLSAMSEPARQTLLFTKIALGTCVAIAAAERWVGLRRSRLLEPLAAIGFYSYFLYLFHFFVIYALGYAFAAAGIAAGFWTMSALTLVLTTAAAAASYTVFEGPLMRLGRGLERSRFVQPRPSSEASQPGRPAASSWASPASTRRDDGSDGAASEARPGGSGA